MSEKNLQIEWKEYYKEHLVDIHTAAQAIKPGDCVWMGQATTIPYAMLDDMYANMEDYHDVMLYYNVMNRPCDMIFDPETKKHFRLTSAYNLPLERISMDMNIVECGGASYDTLQYAVWEYGCNTMALQVCPPDKDGYCNVGAYGVVSHKILSYNPNVTKRIGFIDKTGLYPVAGDIEVNSMHITEFDFICENDTELSTLPASPPTQVDKEIASFILPHIHEGDKVQIGYGGLGEEILANLRGIGHVEVYSEVACDTMVDLCKEGIITKICASSPGACSEKLFEFLRDDPRATLRPQSEMIDPLGVMQQENLVAINATFMIDLIGQACSEAQGLTPYTGPGGSFAYLYGAMRAKNGRSFLCLRSTYVDRQGERHSNIHPWLPEGSIVTTTKVFVMYLVSEFGIADVYLKTIKDRIRAIIKIAHPDYRETLKAQICTTPLISEEDFEGIDLFDNMKKNEA